MDHFKASFVLSSYVGIFVTQNCYVVPGKSFQRTKRRFQIQEALDGVNPLAEEDWRVIVTDSCDKDLQNPQFINELKF